MLRKLLNRCKKTAERDYSAFLRYKEIFSSDEQIISALNSFQAVGDRAPELLDLGGGDGSFIKNYIKDMAVAPIVSTLDIEDHGLERTILHDITEPYSGDRAASFDIIFCYNVFEHLKDPLTAADNVARFAKPGALVLIHTVFSWRYHPVPKDYFRFSDDALTYLFAERNNFEQLVCGYDIARRREDIRGGFFEDRDVPPIDEMGGFRENWQVFFIGKKAL